MPELLDHTPKVVLAVYAHPDDADVAAAGTLARWAKAGCEVHLVVCTDGGKGTPDPDVDVASLAAHRANELAEAAAVVGIASHRGLGMTDGELENTLELRADHDHREVGWALLDALSPAAALPHYFPEQGPAHQVSVAYLSGTLEPDLWVDVTETIDIKVAAVGCHRSQLPESGSWADDVVRGRAAEEGSRAGVSYAEGFRRLYIGP